MSRDVVVKLPTRPAGGGAKAPLDFATLDYMLRNYVLIYTTRTVWDARLRTVLHLDALAAAYPDLIRLWKSSPTRRMVDPDRVVFDPKGDLEPDGGINLFHGLQVEPIQGECGQLLQLINHLCGGELEVIEWLLRWMAYPLQHPGAKMRTAVVMHGDQGAGKNLLWETVMGLYGEYGTIINQDQLEVPYNAWASRKLLVIADEVVTRQELRHHKGRLKTYITGTHIQISEKFLPLRQESNHMNLVFLSNETEPLALDAYDRRHLVVWTSAQRERAFYDAIGAELATGGAAALMWHLIHRVDCGAFNEFTPPPLTAAKASLVELGLPSATLFYREWRDAMLPLPWLHCRSQDLYRAYLHWCRTAGERFPWSLTKFSREIERYCTKARKLLHIPGDDKAGKAVVLHVPDYGGPPIGDEPDSHYLGRLAGEFAQAVGRYVGPP